MNKLHNTSRRRFLEKLALASLGSGMFAASSKLGLMQSALAATGDYSNLTDYKSLVCVFLFGGNDSYNTIVPTDASGYQQYGALRGPLAVPQADLLSLSGAPYGLHPAMGGMRNLYESGRLAVLANVGSLFEPTTRESFQNGSALLPPDLFSHNDQQEIWQTDRPPQAGITQPGWGGRMADLLGEANSNPHVPPTITLAGNNNWQAGVNTLPFSMSAFEGVEEFLFLSDSGWPPWEASRSQAWEQILNAPHPHALEQHAAGSLLTARLQIAELQATLAQAPDIQTQYNEQNFFAVQMRMAARVISIREQLGMKRQLFFVGLGSFDFHSAQVVEQALMLTRLDEAMTSFQANIEELNLADSVLTFTASDFGRTLTANGDGTDHGWGASHFVMGGAVNGGMIHGTMPSLELGGPDDTDDAGRIIPAVSLDQYGATIASWMGIEAGDLGGIFPYLDNFPTSTLGFLNL